MMGRHPDIEMKGIKAAVLGLIPMNGIIEKDLGIECQKKNIGKKAMNSVLKELEAEGTISREAIIIENGCRILYKYNAFPSTIDIELLCQEMFSRYNSILNAKFIPVESFNQPPQNYGVYLDKEDSP